MGLVQGQDKDVGHTQIQQYAVLYLPLKPADGIVRVRRSQHGCQRAFHRNVRVKLHANIEGWPAVRYNRQSHQRCRQLRHAVCLRGGVCLRGEGGLCEGRLSRDNTANYTSHRGAEPGKIKMLALNIIGAWAATYNTDISVEKLHCRGYSEAGERGGCGREAQTNEAGDGEGR